MNALSPIGLFAAIQFILFSFASSLSISDYHTLHKNAFGKEKNERQPRSALHIKTLALSSDSANNGDQRSDKTPGTLNGGAKFDTDLYNPKLTEEEISLLDHLYDKISSDSNLMENQMLEALPQMSPHLVTTLRYAVASKGEKNDIPLPCDNLLMEKIITVGRVLEDVIDTKLQAGRDTLQLFLNCGELRKLDSAIGKAARKGELNMPFFNVLNLNLKDALLAEETEKQEGKEEGPSRYSILQHIYTRCQEEVEKMVDPGVALLNKVLRTPEESIQYNQLKHYLGRPDTSITSPDGKTIQLPPRNALVTIDEFVLALRQAVQQIQDIKQAGATDNVMAANLVESCRQVAIKARLVISEEYGTESNEINKFENDLQPVFRPQG